MKKELPWLNVLGGRMKTTLFYGPWQCRQEFMNGCQRDCASEGYPLMGCMWLADLKFDWEGRLVVPPVSVKAGSRYRALAHAPAPSMGENVRGLPVLCPRAWEGKEKGRQTYV